ncbi:excinuclease ABC subunit C [Candidatus Parcubacteria bacterium]|nr:MAG: excinuclease ABC subunit C [Candidatus Parcubacteria bacterium]
MKQYFVYILTNKNNTVLYTGATNDLLARIWQHKNKVCPGFTSKYNTNKLVYYEIFEDAYEAISREKQIKNLLRSKKETLINKENPKWEDVYDKL